MKVRVVPLEFVKVPEERLMGVPNVTEPTFWSNRLANETFPKPVDDKVVFGAFTDTFGRTAGSDEEGAEIENALNVFPLTSRLPFPPSKAVTATGPTALSVPAPESCPLFRFRVPLTVAVRPAGIETELAVSLKRVRLLKARGPG